MLVREEGGGTLPATTTQSGLAGQVGVNWVQWMVERREEGGREGGRGV